jgi:hypothetical protein
VAADRAQDVEGADGRARSRKRAEVVTVPGHVACFTNPNNTEGRVEMRADPVGAPRRLCSPKDQKAAPSGHEGLVRQAAAGLAPYTRSAAAYTRPTAAEQAGHWQGRVYVHFACVCT